jgi:hypothetical protein
MIRSEIDGRVLLEGTCVAIPGFRFRCIQATGATILLDCPGFPFKWAADVYGRD